jgi:anti-sigma-K factor RskA
MSDTERTGDVIAAEFALDLLEGEELLEARGRFAREPDFANEVEWWKARLAPLADEIGGAEPSPNLWQRIEGSLDGAPAAGAEVVELRQRVQRLQWFAGISSAAAVVALAFLAIPSPTTPPSTPQPTLAAATPLVANVPIEGTPLRLDLTYLPDAESLIVTAVGLEADGVHDHEIWLVPEQGDLISLGVVTPGVVRAHSVPHDTAVQIANGSELLLTREPLGGKPQGQDAGPVVASGQLIQI